MYCKGAVDTNGATTSHRCCAFVEYLLRPAAIYSSHRILPGHEGQGYNIVILSDLLHFHSSHDVLVSFIDALLARSPDARVHVAVSIRQFSWQLPDQFAHSQAGNYTKPQVCDNFLQLSVRAGFAFDEILPSDEREWLGRSAVSGLDKIALRTRKAACRYWVGRRV
jgi:nicotinamide N-methyltransferase